MSTRDLDQDTHGSFLWPPYRSTTHRTGVCSPRVPEAGHPRSTGRAGSFCGREGDSEPGRASTPPAARLWRFAAVLGLPPCARLQISPFTRTLAVLDQGHPCDLTGAWSPREGLYPQIRSRSDILGVRLQLVNWWGHSSARHDRCWAVMEGVQPVRKEF